MVRNSLVLTWVTFFYKEKCRVCYFVRAVLAETLFRHLGCFLEQGAYDPLALPSGLSPLVLKWKVTGLKARLRFVWNVNWLSGTNDIGDFRVHLDEPIPKERSGEHAASTVLSLIPLSWLALFHLDRGIGKPGRLFQVQSDATSRVFDRQ